MATKFIKSDRLRLNLSRPLFLFALIFIFSINLIQAEYYSLEELNFTMDLPEGFSVTDASETGDSFFFETKYMPVKFALKIYDEDKYKSPEEVVTDAMSQLGCNGEIENFDWYKRPVSLTTFAFVLPDQKLYAGWAMAIKAAAKDNSGTSSAAGKKNKWMLFLTYADSTISRDCDQYMLSILDSVFFCKEDCRRPGPVTTFAYSSKENTSPELSAVSLTIGGKTFTSTIAKDAIERSNFVLEREFAVLSVYANNPHWKEAWQRYYREVFRESFNAFDQISRDIYKNLMPTAQRKSPQNPDFEILKMLLDWVQDFEYKRDRTSTDFTAITAAVQGVGSDCDSRSMLMCVLLEHLGIKSELFISREYSHAVFGAAVKENGAAITVDNVNYVLGETTAKVDFGRIAQEQSDTAKWIPVDLP